MIFCHSCGSPALSGIFLPKLSDSPYLTREAEMPHTLLECDTLKQRAIGHHDSPNR